MATATISQKESQPHVVKDLSEALIFMRGVQTEVTQSQKDRSKIAQLNSAYPDLFIRGSDNEKAKSTFIGVLTDREYARFDARDNDVINTAKDLISKALSTEDLQAQGSIRDIHQKVSRINAATNDN